MSFHDIRFPANISFGSPGGPERLTEIVTLANGFEERNTPWAHSRRRYDAGFGLRGLADLERLLAFFEARRGQLHGFRWKDWADFKSCPAADAITPFDQRIGLGDGATTGFALSKLYVSGTESYLRPIAKPVAGTVVAALAYDPKVEGSDFSVDAATGILSFASPPDIGVVVTAGFEFDVPVRFDTDRLQVSVAAFQAGELPVVPLIEVRL